MKRLMYAMVVLFDNMLPFIALGCIGTGTWFIYPPAAPIVVGLLIWIDLHRKETP